MAVELPEGTLILSIPSDKSIARTLGASQTDREDEKTLSKRQIAVALGAQAPTESSKTAFRIGAFVASINAALAVKTPRNLSFNAATKTLTWDKPSWALTTFYRVEKRVQPLLSSPEDGFNDLAARTSATSLVDNAYDSTLNTEYKVWPIAAMEEDQIAQPALLHIRTPGSPLITVAIECPHPLFPGSAATLSATVVGVPPQTPVVWFWKTDVGTLLPNATNPRPSATRSNAENPVLHIPADTTAEEVLISVEPLTYGLDNLYHGIRCPIMQKTLTIDLTFAPFPSGSNPNFLYGGRPVALRTAVGGTVAQSTAAPRIVYTITHGTLSLSQREAGTGTELTVNGYDQVWWHRPPVPSLGTNRRIATLVTGTATVFLEGLEASDIERCFLEWPPPPAFLTAEITGGSDIREGTANTQVLTCTPRGTAIGDVTYDWLAPTLGTLGTSADGNSASTVTYTAPANVDADTSVTITCRVRRQGLETLASTTFKVTNEATLTLDFGLFEGVLEYPNAIEYGTSYQCRPEVGGSATGSVDYRWVVFAAVAATGRASGVFTDTNTRQSTGIRPSVTTPATNVTGLSEFMEINLRVRKYASGSSGQRLSKTLTKRYSLRGTVPPPTPPPPPTDPDKDSWTLSVSGGQNQIQSGRTMNLTASVSGAGAVGVTYAWTGTGGTFSSTTGRTTTWTAPTATGSQTITCTATTTNENADSATKTATIATTVVAQPVPLSIAISGMPSVVGSGTAVSLTASVSGGTGGTFSIAWSATRGTVSPSTGSSTTWTAPTVTGSSAASVSAVVTQGTASASAVASTTISAAPVPTFTLSLADGSIDEGGTLDLLAAEGGTATGPITEVSWTGTGVTPTSGLAATWLAPQVEAHTAFPVTVSAKRQGVIASASASLTSRNVPKSEPNAPTVNIVSIRQDSFTVTWRPGTVGPTIAEVTGWKLTISGGSATQNITTAASNFSLLITGLTPETRYTVFVSATSAEGDSEAGTASATTLAIPKTFGINLSVSTVRSAAATNYQFSARVSGNATGDVIGISWNYPTDLFIVEVQSTSATPDETGQFAFLNVVPLPAAFTSPASSYDFTVSATRGGINAGATLAVTVR